MLIKTIRYSIYIERLHCYSRISSHVIMKDLECQWNVRRSHQHQPAAMGGRVFYFFQIPSVPLSSPILPLGPLPYTPHWALRSFSGFYQALCFITHMKEFYLWAATEVFTASCVKVALPTVRRFESMCGTRTFFRRTFKLSTSNNSNLQTCE